MKKKKLIQSLQRADDILSIFIQEKRSLGITDFSNKLKLPKTTIASIVSTLMELRYLEKDHITGKYRLGPKLFQFGMKYATNMDLVLIARVWMERLCFQFREPVNVGMMVGNKVVVVLRVEPENRFMTFPQTGSVIPLHTTCIGKILCAHMDPLDREDILRDCSFEKLTENSIDNRESFLNEIGIICKHGISFDKQESVNGLAGIGGPIFNFTGQAIAAFAITGKAENILKNREEIINAVKYTSTQISSQLGYNIINNSPIE